MTTKVVVDMFDNKDRSVDRMEKKCENHLEVARYLRRISERYRWTPDAEIAKFGEVLRRRSRKPIK